MWTTSDYYGIIRYYAWNKSKINAIKQKERNNKSLINYSFYFQFSKQYLNKLGTASPVPCRD